MAPRSRPVPVVGRGSAGPGGRGPAAPLAANRRPARGGVTGGPPNGRRPPLPGPPIGWGPWGGTAPLGEGGGRAGTGRALHPEGKQRGRPGKAPGLLRGGWQEVNSFAQPPLCPWRRPEAGTALLKILCPAEPINIPGRPLSWEKSPRGHWNSGKSSPPKGPKQGSEAQAAAAPWPTSPSPDVEEPPCRGTEPAGPAEPWGKTPVIANPQRPREEALNP
ncbi:translation initiation factor IF-2-like [Tachyglossus aculeatus]|uniref:translation initiation factor IF-2-like n=1 Tax=Tachyglossus aculeatus TaxID=9261 RepID=UPI0018F2E91D|nr:translation initiation factor IF-2-like [Tachyglossus aculeatus]